MRHHLDHKTEAAAQYPADWAVFGNIVVPDAGKTLFLRDCTGRT